MAAEDTSTVQKFFNMWRDSFIAVLGQVGVVAAAGTMSEPAAGPAPAQEDMEKSVSVSFSGGGVLKGGLLWMAERSAAVQLAQVLLSEEPQAAAEFSKAHEDGFAEMMRRVATLAAASWKQETGSDTEITFQPETTSETLPVESGTLLLKGEKLPEISLRLFLNTELCGSLLAWKAAPVEETVVDPPLPGAIVPEEPEAAKPEPAKLEPAEPELAEPEEEIASEKEPGAAQNVPRNLDLLLDVELDATIRFGDRSMLLRDIFGLVPGAVVELNQQVNALAELLVAGRLIARGEVVVVDGNFGIRVTSVISPGQRAELLQL